MTQLDLLWEYQLADTEADNMAQSIRQSPKRQKLLKLRDYIREQQESLNTLENELHAMSDRMDVLKEAISLADDQLKDLQKRVLVRNGDRAVVSWNRAIIERNTGTEGPVFIVIIGGTQCDAISIFEAFFLIEQLLTV